MGGGKSAMKPEVRDLVARCLDSPVKLDIMLFFQANPATTDTPEGVALRIYRSREEVRSALAELAEDALLNAVALGRGRYLVYSLSEDRTLRQALADLSWCYHYHAEDRREISRLIVERQHARRQAEGPDHD